MLLLLLLLHVLLSFVACAGGRRLLSPPAELSFSIYRSGIGPHSYCRIAHLWLRLSTCRGVKGSPSHVLLAFGLECSGLVTTSQNVSARIAVQLAVAPVAVCSRHLCLTLATTACCQ